MKKKITLFFICIYYLSFAQIPQQINYQGIARDASGIAISNETIRIKFELRSGSPSSPVLFSETQSISTNSLGLFTTQIGKITPGGISGINWSSGSVFLNTAIDPLNGTNFIDLGIQALFSVPFALAANSPSLSFNGNTLTVGSNTVELLTITAGNNVNLSGGPNYTISAVTPSLILFGNNLSINGSNGVNLPISYPQTTVTSSGIVSVTPVGTNSFNINVPLPIYSNNTGALAFGQNTTIITPSLTLLPNGVLSAGPLSNSIALFPITSLIGAGYASVSLGPNYIINVTAPPIGYTNNVLNVGPISNSITLPIAYPQSSITAGGLATINSLGTNSFNINVPAPSYNGSSGVLTFGTNTSFVIPNLLFSNGNISSGPTSNSISLTNYLPWQRTLNTVTLASAFDNVAIGANNATSKLEVIGSNTTATSIIKVINNNLSSTSPALDVQTNGASGFSIFNSNPTGVGANFNAIGTSLSTQNSGPFHAFQSTSNSSITSAYAGQFIGGLVTSGKNNNLNGFAFKAQDNLSTDLLVVRNDGNIGVGTSAPTANLHVNGNLRIVDGTQGANKVLTCDAVGNASWTAFNGVGGLNAWSLNGNTLTVDGTNFIGTTDNVPFNIRVNNQKAGRIDHILANTFFGFMAGNSNTIGYQNTAIGTNALYANTTGNDNTANGYWSLTANTSGNRNISTGNYAMQYNTIGSGNTASGYSALLANTSGYNNIAVGYNALYSNTTGNHNTAIGFYANVASGNLSNATAIGNGAVVNASDKILLGNTAVTVIGGQVGWSTLSDGRFKSNVRDYKLGLDFINKLNPVSYTYNNSENGLVFNGFIAQDVENTLKKLGIEFSGLSKPQNKDDNYSLRYGDFVVPLVNAVKELQQMIEKQNTSIERLMKRIEDLEKR